MNEHSDKTRNWKAVRQKVIGLGEESFRKSYYPELQQRLAQLEESETRFRAIFDSVGDAIFVHDADTGAILNVNQRVCDLWGYPKEDILGRDVPALSAAEAGFTQERVTGLFRQVAAGKPQIVEWLAQDKNGRRFWMDMRLQSAVIGGERVVLVAARDISDQKAAQEALREHEVQLRTLINEMPDIVCFKDGDGRWIETNDFHLKLFQLTDVDYHGKTDSDLAGDHAYFRQVLAACQNTDDVAWRLGRASHADEYIPVPDGGYKTFDIVKVPTFNPDGTRKGLVVIGRDITDRKRAEEQQRALDEHKRRFYRDTILSVTEGKLEMCDVADIAPYIANATLSIPVTEPLQARDARLQAQSVFGLSHDQLGEFEIAAGEAISNMLKHATGGLVYAGKRDGEIWIAVQDKGPGIESLILPSAVLRRGFSTKPSMGLGYSIMLAASDRILLQTGGEGTTVVLIKDTHIGDATANLVGQWTGDLSSEL